MDTTTRHVRSLLYELVADAYGITGDAVPLEDVCGTCGHHLTAHHGPDGHGRCGEAGCACAAFSAATCCPDCGEEWVPEADACRCGLTVYDLAERL